MAVGVSGDHAGSGAPDAAERALPAEPSAAALSGLCLDEESFKHFAPLLSASQAYAQQSGFRFRSVSFDGLEADGDEDTAAAASVPIPVVGGRRSQDSGLRLATKLRAAPLVRRFAERLRVGEPSLMEELDRAFRIVMVESVRNSMVGTCQELGVFPPNPPPDGIADDDCAYEDVSAPLPMIAQRLYNDQVRRLSYDAAVGSTGVGNRLQRRAMTAAFLVDFAHETGTQLPPMPETYQAMLQEFATRASEWAGQSGGAPAEARARKAFLDSLRNFGALEQGVRAEAQKWVSEHKADVAFWATAGAVALGAAAVAVRGLSRVKRSQ